MTNEARPVARNGRAKKLKRADPPLSEMVVAVMRGARLSGLLGDKSARIGGRVSPALVQKAKQRTGLDADTDLIEFALATIALDDEFPDAFEKSRGTVDPDIKLGY